MDGLFRVSGSAVEIQQLKKDYESGNFTSIKLKLTSEGKSNPLEKCNNVHNVSGLFKLYLRELPEPVFPLECYVSLINSQSK